MIDTLEQARGRRRAPAHRSRAATGWQVDGGRPRARLRSAGGRPTSAARDGAAGRVALPTVAGERALDRPVRSRRGDAAGRAARRDPRHRDGRASSPPPAKNPGPGSSRRATTSSGCWPFPAVRAERRGRVPGGRCHRDPRRADHGAQDPRRATRACEFDDARNAALRNGTPPGLCLHVVVDEIAERFLTMVDGFDDSIDELEDHVKDWPSTEIRERISSIRHDILHVRRVLAPTRDAARRGARRPRRARRRVSLFPATSSCTSPTPTTSCCARPTASTCHATCSPACATSTRPRSRTIRTRS